MICVGEGLCSSLFAPEKAVAYSTLSKDYKLTETNAEIITIQAETAKIKNSKSLIPKSNNSDAGMTPTNPYTSKINYIGGTSWQSPGSAMNWTFKKRTLSSALHSMTKGCSMK